MRWWLARVTCWGTASVVSIIGGGACHAGESLGPDDQGPPYIAIVPKLETGTLPDAHVQFKYHVVDLSEGGVLDTMIVKAPTDTLILSVRPATYAVTLENIPEKCVS